VSVKALAILVALLAACGDNVQLTRDAAEDLAAVTCARRIECGPQLDRTFEQCVEWTVDEMCGRVDCEAPYERGEHLAACLAAYAERTCREPVTICGL
jgi:hypothetical protein